MGAIIALGAESLTKELGLRKATLESTNISRANSVKGDVGENLSGNVTSFKRLTCYEFGHVTTGLGTWRTHCYLLYLVALLPLSLFFRFVVLVTVHLYDSL